VANCNDLTQSVTEDNGWPTHSSEFLDNSQDYSEDQNAYTCGGDREFFAIKDDPNWAYNEGSGFFGISNTFLGENDPLCVFKLIRINNNYELSFLNSNRIIYSTDFIIQNSQQGNSVGSFFGSFGTTTSGVVVGDVVTSNPDHINITTIINTPFLPNGRARLINELDDYGSPTPDIFDAKETKTAKYSAEVQVDSYATTGGIWNSNVLVVGFFTSHRGENSADYVLPIEKGIIFRPSGDSKWACSFYQQVNNTTPPNLYQEHDFYETTYSIYDRLRLRVVLDNYGTVAKWYINDELVRTLNIENFTNIPVIGEDLSISNIDNFIYSVSDDQSYRKNKCYVGCEVRHRKLAQMPSPPIPISLKIFNSVFETKQS
jgi:hypothetical protein